MKQTFYPSWAELDRQTIAETIASVLDINTVVTADDPRLTDELCQEIADNWNTEGIWDEDIKNPLWEDEDTLHQEWEMRFKAIFQP